jgi:hypothetical protein
MFVWPAKGEELFTPDTRDSAAAPFSNLQNDYAAFAFLRMTSCDALASINVLILRCIIPSSLPLILKRFCSAAKNLFLAHRFLIKTHPLTG